MTVRTYCENCRRPLTLCYCSRVPVIDNLWPVHILQHPQESRHALGTARIARLGLTRCTLASVGQAPLPACDDTVLIYPGDDAMPLSALLNSPRRPLLFLDATWRKSRRMLFESPALAAMPRYALQSPPPSRYRIRREPDAQALSTLEAIVFTLGFLEGDAEKYLPLLQVMDHLIAQQIDCMGHETFAKNYAASQ